jgi:putative aminopeptidase FrvX
MTMIDKLIDDLRTLTNLPGGRGAETAVAAYIARSLGNLGIACSIDRIGNVITHAAGPVRALVTAHMDQVGFMVSRIDSEIHCLPVGGVAFESLGPQPVRIFTANGVVDGILKPRFPASKPARRWAVVKTPQANEVRVGDRVLFASELEETAPGIVRGQALDDRIGCYLLLHAAQDLRDLDGVVFAWTVREEGEYAGVLHATRNLNPEVVISVDATYASDEEAPANGESVIRVGGGPVVTLLDGGMVADESLLATLAKAAAESELNWQREVVSGGVSEAGSALQTLGVPGLALLVPIRGEHSPVEEASTEDVKRTLVLLLATIRALTTPA